MSKVILTVLTKLQTIISHMVISFLYPGTMFITSGIRNSLMSKYCTFIIFHISLSCVLGGGGHFFGADPIDFGIDMTLSNQVCMGRTLVHDVVLIRF